ncbi:MAG: hypothetical protein AAGM22_22830 [Acidobacteriota bacterium]
MSSKSVSERVKAGAEWLDGVMPEWWRRVDPARLDMSSGTFWPGYVFDCGCVAAQLDAFRSDGFGTLCDFVQRYEMTDSDVRTLGFDALDIERGDDIFEYTAGAAAELEQLGDAWKLEISARRSQA